jgi:hypothetical protein
MTEPAPDPPPDPGLESPAVTAPVSGPVTAPADTLPADPAAEHASVDLGRIGWLIITCGLAVGVLVLLLKREWGYAAVSGAVAISAAINLL